MRDLHEIEPPSNLAACVGRLIVRGLPRFQANTPGPIKHARGQTVMSYMCVQCVCVCVHVAMAVRIWLLRIKLCTAQVCVRARGVRRLH